MICFFFCSVEPREKPGHLTNIHMEDLEFKKYRQMIEDQKVVADTYKNSFNSNLEPLNKAITTIVDNIDKRNNLLREYTDDVHFAKKILNEIDKIYEDFFKEYRLNSLYTE